MTGCDNGTTSGAEPQTPVADDYDIRNLTQIVDSVIPVTVTPKAGKSSGAITIYYDDAATLPSAAGAYAVTFDVAAATGWKEATGVSAGTLTVYDLSTPFTAIADLGTFLSGISTNTAATAYTVKLNVDNISTTLGTLLRSNNSKYVYLDLSGSTITSIPNNAFYPNSNGCTTLTGITIPDIRKTTRFT